jgi:hypothetical protein
LAYGYGGLRDGPDRHRAARGSLRVGRPLDEDVDLRAVIAVRTRGAALGSAHADGFRGAAAAGERSVARGRTPGAATDRDRLHRATVAAVRDEHRALVRLHLHCPSALVRAIAHHLALPHAGRREGLGGEQRTELAEIEPPHGGGWRSDGRDREKGGGDGGDHARSGSCGVGGGDV